MQFGDLVKIDARNLVIMVTVPQTNKQSHKQTHRRDRLQYTAPLSLAQSVTSLACQEVMLYLCSLCINQILLQQKTRDFIVEKYNTIDRRVSFRAIAYAWYFMSK